MATTNAQQPQQQLLEYQPLERALSWQDIRDAPSLSSRRSSVALEEEEQYRYVDCSNRKYRKPPIHFSISVTRIDGDTTKKTCHPGSIFEGNIRIKLESPLAAQYLKVVFKAAEHIHSDSIGKEAKKKGERLFAIRTIRWGSVNSGSQQWPIMEAGLHQFPFMCELPMVNYPPSFRHHLASCEFELLAILERPGIRPFQTAPYFLWYEPYVLSSPIKSPDIYQEKLRISNNYKVEVTLLKGCHFNLLDTNSADILKIRLSIIPLGSSAAAAPDMLNHIEAYIKREVNVTHGSYKRSDTMVMTHIDQSQFGVAHHKNGVRTYYIRLPIPSQLNKNNNATILKNFSMLGMTPTLNFSRHIKMDYKLYITAKLKSGLIATKKQLFCIPIQFGTVAPGEQLPSSLLSYRDPQVISDTTLETKPKFVKPPSVQEQLPAYDEDLSPPLYAHISSSRGAGAGGAGAAAFAVNTRRLRVVTSSLS